MRPAKALETGEPPAAHQNRSTDRGGAPYWCLADSGRPLASAGGEGYLLRHGRERNTAMLDPRTLDEVVARLSALVPPGLDRLQEDASRSLRAAVAAALERMNLVTRQELDAQVAVLARTRARAEALEQRVAELERVVAGRPGVSGSGATAAGSGAGRAVPDAGSGSE